MTERSLLEFIAQKVSKLADDVEYLKSEVGSLKSEVNLLKQGQLRLENEVKKTNNLIEHDIKPKIEVLFDGYQQNHIRLNRLESNTNCA